MMMLQTATIRQRSSSLRLRFIAVSRSLFSTQTPNNVNVDVSKQTTNNNRVPKTLYRQLLVWCRRYNDVPFNPLPPVTLSPPQVNSLALKRLKDMRTFLHTNEVKESMNIHIDGIEKDVYGTGGHPAHYAMYRDDVTVTENMITFPEIHDSNQLQSTIRSIYWLNNQHTVDGVMSENDTKEQIKLAFDAIKSCNQLSSSELDTRRSKREDSIKVRQNEGTYFESEEKFPNVTYHVGQVVQQNKDQWRGVIVGWSLEKDNKNNGQLSSLTTKQYTIKDDAEDTSSSTESNLDEADAKSKVQYTILVDYNDASLLQSSKTVTLESQDDLTAVDDPCLQRIHNNLIKQYFIKFTEGHFKPNNILSYMYPLDKFSVCTFGVENEKNEDDAESQLPPELEKSSLAITKGVQEISRRLLIPLQSFEHKDEDGNEAASSLISSLTSDVQSMQIHDKSSRFAIATLAKLYHFHVKINAMVWTREKNRKHKKDIEYSLGQIVKHKRYGFRGFVAAWDRKPRFDVSNWDGLQEVESPMTKPFYHVYPDVNDCIRAFGGPRNWRYCCQDNLELSSHNDNPLEFEMELDEDDWRWDAERGMYVPSAEMKFMYAEDLGKHEIELLATVRNLRDIITECLLKIRDGGNGNNMFTMDDLFYQLQVGAQNLDDATIVQDFIREIWKENPNCDLRNQLDNGISELIEGKHESALKTFANIVTADPLYGEAWNKKATVHYMMGHTHNSIECAQQALEIDELNFQALAGMGLLDLDASRYDRAINNFKKALKINPWLGTVASRLAACIVKKIQR